MTLSITKNGSGSGTVTGAPAGINCGAICSQSIVPGTALTLTATAAAGSIFAGWTGACSGIGSCSITVNVAATATATFNLVAPPSPPGEPDLPRVTLLSADSSGVTFALVWTPGTGATSYAYTAAFSDGTAAQQGTVTVLLRATPHALSRQRSRRRRLHLCPVTQRGWPDQLPSLQRLPGSGGIGGLAGHLDLAPRSIRVFSSAGLREANPRTSWIASVGGVDREARGVPTWMLVAARSATASPSVSKTELASLRRRVAVAAGRASRTLSNGARQAAGLSLP